METINYKDYIIEITQDDYAESPRDWDNIGTMVCLHSRYKLGDKQSENFDYASSWHEEIAYYFNEEYAIRTDSDGYTKDYLKDTDIEMVYKWINKNIMILPLYLYDHSGISMSTSPFSCTWDSGQVGFIYADKETALKEYGNKILTKAVRDKVLDYMQGEVKNYDQYLRGEVYSYNVIDSDGDNIDSCSGFYEKDYCISEAKSIIDWQEKRIQEITERDKAKLNFSNKYFKLSA